MTERSNTPWTPAEAILAHRLRLAGASFNKIALHLPGRTVPAIRALFRSLHLRGIRIGESETGQRPVIKPPVHVPLVAPEVVKKERDAGLTLTAIAKKYGVGRTCISKYAKMAQQMENRP